MRSVAKRVVAVLGLAFVSPMLAFGADSPIGRVEYERNCAMCHGATGKGDGWLAESLKRPVPSLAQLKRRNGGALSIEQVLQVIDGRREVALHGPREMPVWGDVYSAKARGELGSGRGTYDVNEVVRSRILELTGYVLSLQE